MYKKILYFAIIVALIIAGIFVAKQILEKEDTEQTSTNTIENANKTNEENQLEENNLETNNTDENNVVENEVTNNTEPGEIQETPEEQAKQLVKDNWGEDDAVYFSYDGKDENGRYIICVREKETTKALYWYYVDLETGTFDIQ